MLPQLAEGLALALEPLVAAVCSRHILKPRVQCESGESHDTRDTSDTSDTRHVATIQDMILRRGDLNHWRIQA